MLIAKNMGSGEICVFWMYSHVSMLLIFSYQIFFYLYQESVGERNLQIHHDQLLSLL